MPRKVLKDDKAKFGWIDTLSSEDEIFTELGASADILCALAIKKGVTIHRIQTRLLKEWRTQQGLDKSDTFPSLVHFAQNRQGDFYEVPLAMQQVLGLQCNVRHFEITQEMRKSEAHRLRNVATMEYYLQEHGQPSADAPAAMTKEEQKTLSTKLTEIVAQARSQIVGELEGKVDPKSLRKISAQLAPGRQARSIVKEAAASTAKDTDLEIYLKRRFAESDIFWGVEHEEQFYAVEVENMLEGMEVYKCVFKKIPGMGPKVAGRIIASIGDIRRFETAFSVSCYFGWHVRPDGSCPRRQKGIGQADKRKEMADKGQRSVDFGGWNDLGRQGMYLWAEQVNKATPDRAPELYKFKEMQVARKAYVARKYWSRAATQVAGSIREPSEALLSFVKVLQNMPEAWLRSGEALPEDAANPYLVCARELQVVQSPWLLRDALAELLKRAGEDVADEEEEDEQDSEDAQDAKDDQNEGAKPSGQSLQAEPEAKKAPVKVKFLLPQLELSAQMKREIRAVIRSQFLSKKRIHQGATRWLINNVLIRKYIWPLYREFVGLSKHCDPRISHEWPRPPTTEGQVTIPVAI